MIQDADISHHILTERRMWRGNAKNTGERGHAHYLDDSLMEQIEDDDLEVSLWVRVEKV